MTAQATRSTAPDTRFPYTTAYLSSWSSRREREGQRLGEAGEDRLSALEDARRRDEAARARAIEEEKARAEAREEKAKAPEPAPEPEAPAAAAPADRKSTRLNSSH